MKIEKIELSGFKSFADKTTFTFHPGITGIVGPNGCGKSNLVDAFKWLLGEQSAKALRSNKMDEVIFNGSATKKPKGMAEVSVYISGLYTPEGNGDGAGENNITVITRRLYRSGESEYLINNNICRLKDIRDILLDTGLDVKNYFIFEHERLIHLINAKPEERRFLIEEIAGVIKYKVKRAEAQSKLEHSRLNLQRINDIISEVKKQLNALQRQVRKAEKYRKLSEERKNLELYLLKINFEDIKSKVNSTINSLNALRYEEAQRKAEIDTLDNTIQEKRLNLIEKEKVLNSLYSELENIEREISENTKKEALIAQQLETLNREIEEFEKEKQELTLKKEDTHKKIHEIEGIKEDLLKEKEGLNKRHNELHALIETQEIEFRDVERRLEELRKKLFSLSEEQSRIKNELMRIQTIKEQIEKRNKEILREIENEEMRIQEITSREETLKQEIMSIEEDAMLIKERLDGYTDDLENLNKEIEFKTQTLQSMKENLASVISRLESLQELLIDETSKEILNEREGIHVSGILSEFMNVPERYENAVESALYERINSFVLDDEKALLNAINLIKEKGITRTGFVVKNLITSQNKESIMLPLDKKIWFIPAREVVETEESLRLIINNLLGNTVIVENIDDALELKNAGFIHPVVTIQGEYIDNGGVVWSGKSREILKRKRELRELEEKKENTLREMELLNQDIEGIRRKISKLKGEISTLEESLDSREDELRSKRHTINSILQEKERISKRLTYLRTDLKESEDEYKKLTEEIEEKLRLIDNMESERATIETEIEDVRSTQSKSRVDFEENEKELLNIKLSINTMDERIKTFEKEVGILKSSLQEIENTLNKINDKKESFMREIDSLKTQSSSIRETLSQLVIKADRTKTEINSIKDEMENENQWFVENESLLKNMRSGLNELLAKINEFEVIRAQDFVRLETIKENLRINYGITINEEGQWLRDGGGFYTVDYQDELKEKTLEDIIQRIEEIKKGIEELGLVNTGSIDEFDELKQRYDFLMIQHEDLTKSISELEEAISKINATTRKRLREAFDALNAKFTEVFTTLFGGGRAHLSLTDENNILESGIEIIAQPPGKRLQNINLLSGGEKALTALSLLFASFLLKPAPICILDETDAPLDESNVVRFASMIKELSDKIQFIVITHNKTTMNYCDYLYGVTMEEPGSSRIISIELTNIND